MLTANEIRRQFIDFFVERHGHTFVPSSPVAPRDDPSLMFANAGMNQFKDVFLGAGTRPYQRAVNTQKCIRAGGKHNDLDDVGKDTYHHTFFEMLGNWSFGDYFKKEAIRWAWELLTDVWKLEKSRLHATVFKGDPDHGVEPDEEAAELWRTVTDINPEHVHYFGKEDNFWEMGETGPCGPCSEIHYDYTPDASGAGLVNAGRPEVIEIWNLVFIQFNRNEDKSLTPLPAKHVDTGMGFERITTVLQDKKSNYDTDIFTPIIAAIAKLTGKVYEGGLDNGVDIGFRAIADHLRMATFAIADGARPGNKRAGSVLKSVIRRAVRFGYQYFDLRRPFLCSLAPVITEQMGDSFPEIQEQRDHIVSVLRDEETDFYRTIQRGMGHFQDVVNKTRQANDKQILGEDAAKLLTTYGFPIDLTKQMAEENDLEVDMEAYEAAMEEHRKISNQGSSKFVITAVQGELPQTDDAPKYKRFHVKAKVLGWVVGNEVIDRGTLQTGDRVALIADKTNFYAEQGGQVGDKGTILSKNGTFIVEDTQQLGDSVLHIGQVAEGTIQFGERIEMQVSSERPDTMRNHTATHLLNWALRAVLGHHVEQKGSLVDSEKTRFDFTHDAPLTKEEVYEIERLVNDQIQADLPVSAVTMPLEDAQKITGVRAVFGEKYPDPVRVLMIGANRPEKVTEEHSVEFCGGTHLTHTGEAGLFKIVSQELVAKGVRRVTAVSGRGAVATVQKLDAILTAAAQQINCQPDELTDRIEAMQSEIKKLQKQLKKGAASELQNAADQIYENAIQNGEAKIIIGELPGGPIEQMRNQIDRLRQKAGSAVIVVGWKEDGKVGLIVSATDDLTKKGVHSGKLIGQIAKIVGGAGGGKPAMAQAGGKDPEKLAEALATAKKLILEKI